MAATSVIAIALVPALKLIREGIQLGREVETRNLLTTYAISKLEQHLALAAAAWTPATASGNFSADGNATVLYQAVRSDESVDGGITDRLMSVRVTVWEDANGNSALDSGELNSTFRSKIAKLQTYEDEATGS